MQRPPVGSLLRVDLARSDGIKPLRTGGSWAAIALAVLASFIIVQPAAALQHGSPDSLVRVIGGPGTPRDHELGIAEDVVMDGHGRVFVLDSRLNNIRFFNREGLELQTVGRPGRDAGELFVPVALALTRDGGRLIALDGGNTKLLVYRVRDSLLLEFEIELGFQGWDVCTIGNRVFVLGFDRDSLIHEYALSREARRVRSFGEPHGSSSIARRLSGRGFLSCVDAAAPLVVRSGVEAPTIEAYAPTGQRVWSRTLSEFRGVVIEERGGVVSHRSPGPGGYHMILGMFPLPSGSLAVVVGLVNEPRFQGDATGIEARVIGSEATESRPSVAVGEWRLVGTVGSYAYGVNNFPPPRVAIFRSRRLTGLQ